MKKLLVKLLAATLLLCCANGAYAAMYGYLTNPTGIYRINTGTGATTLIYGGTPFNGTTVVPAAAQRSSDGQIFFIFGNAGNDSVYRYDPANAATAPVLLGTTGAGVNYILRLTQHPITGEIWAMNDVGTTLYVLSQTTGAATVRATLTGWPGLTSGDIAFEFGTNRLIGATYATVNSVTALRIYSIPLAGGAITTLGNITGLAASPQAVTSLMIDGYNNVFLGGTADNNLYELVNNTGNPTAIGAVSNGGAAVNVGDMGRSTQDFATASSPTPGGTKSFNPSVVAPGQDTTMSLTLSNTFENPLRGLTLVDNYPANLVTSPTPAITNTCGGTVTAAAGGNTLSVANGTIPAAVGATPGTCTITVKVRSSTGSSYTNCIAIGGESTILSFNDTAFCSTVVVGVPALSFAKSNVVVTDPINGATNPKRIPGAFVDYTLAVTNAGPGQGDSNTVVITDPIPANTALFVGDLNGAAAGTSPAIFTNGTPSSGLTYTFTSLASTTDDVDFSNDNGATFTYVPTADANGVDTAVTNIRLSPKGTILGNSGGAGNPNFAFQFRVRVK